MFILSFVYTV